MKVSRLVGLETDFLRSRAFVDGLGLGLEVMWSRSCAFKLVSRLDIFGYFLFDVIVMSFALCLKIKFRSTALPQIEQVKSLESNFFYL